MISFEIWIKTHPECFLNFLMRYVVEYKRIIKTNVDLVTIRN